MAISSLIPMSLIPGNKTDKADSRHSFAGESYLHVYDRYFYCRRSISSLLEIGVLNGDSLRLWRDFFPMATIWGLDIDPSRTVHSGKRIQVVIGDQSDEKCLRDLGKLAGGFDIIIDDGSHITSHISASLHGLWPSLKPCGVYAIEDLGISYNPLNPEKCIKFWPGMEYNGDLAKKRHSRSDFEDEILKMIHTMDALKGDVRAVHFHPMQVVIEKA